MKNKFLVPFFIFLLILPTYAMQLPQASADSVVPFYRLWCGDTDHLYTTDKAGRDDAINHGWCKDEGITGYIYSSQASGTTPLYRLYSASITDHFYTTDKQESDNAVANSGYNY